MNRPSSDLPRLLLRLLLLPLVLFWVPLMFAMAWVHEVLEDLRPPRLRPAPLLLPTHAEPPVVPHSLLRPRLRH